MEMFSNIKYYCMFVGYGKSGHTLIGCLLDAHPDVMVSIEADVLGQIAKNKVTDKKEIFEIIHRRSVNFVKNSNYSWTGYSYKVENQYQGKFQNLKVVGDKRGGGSSLYINRQPELLDKLKSIIGRQVKFIHVKRNPFDIVASFKKSSNLSLEALITMFDNMANGTQVVIESENEENIFEFKHEDFLNETEQHLVLICNFLGIDPVEDYIKSCSNIVYDEPHETRHEVKWTNILKEKLQSVIDKYNFLKGYTFDNALV